MKIIAALTTFGVLALASAGASGARGELGPTPGQPDPARVVLRSTDLGGARVTHQGYYREQGYLVSYARTFSLAHAGAVPLISLESDASLAASSSIARDDVAGFHQFLSTPAGRAALVHAFQSADTSALVVSHVRVVSLTPISGTSGWDVDLRFTLLGLPTEAHIAVFTANRFLGELMMLGTPGRAVPHTTVVHLAQIVTRRFNAAQPPKNLTAPTISGVAAVGQTLSASPGTWANAPTSYRFQWGRCTAQSSCNEIQGATAAQYTPAATDAGSTLIVWVTAVNVNGTRNAVSAATDPVLAPPTLVELPAITGTPVVGQVLTATTGTWTGSPTSYSFSWEACDAQGLNCNAVSGSSQSWTLTPGDVGLRLVAVVTATNAAGSTTAASQPTAVVVSAG